MKVSQTSQTTSQTGQIAPLELTLIRHGNTPWNTAGRYQGFSDVALSPLGIAQARALGQRLSSQTFDAAYTSDMRRTQQTAQYALAHAHCPPLVADPRLRELNFGEFEGLTEAENRQHAGWDIWQADPWHAQVPGGESMHLLSTRAQQWLSELEGGSVVAFSHGLTIRTLIWHLMGWPTDAPAGGWSTPFPFDTKLPHTSISRLTRTAAGHWEMVTLSDIGHLEPWSGLLEEV